MFKISNFIPLIAMILVLSGIAYIAKINYKPDPNLQKVEQGKASKIEYQGHSYVVWSINLGGGIVHDPDCKCHHNGN